MSRIKLIGESEMDVFEKLKERVGCQYISDMANGAFCNSLARVSVRTMELIEYELDSLRALWEYLTGEKMDAIDKAQLIQSLQKDILFY
ncbi:MAG: hypothetical protein Q4A88_03700 [Clostridia bacterium]|nr:hypothetical protein [Clostridia bacterium]